MNGSIIHENKLDYFVYKKDNKYFVFGGVKYVKHVIENIEGLEDISLENSLGVCFSVFNDFKEDLDVDIKEKIASCKGVSLSERISFLSFKLTSYNVKALDLDRLNKILDETLKTDKDKIKYYIVLQTDYGYEDEVSVVYNLMEKLDFNIYINSFKFEPNKATFYLARKAFELPIDYEKIEKHLNSAKEAKEWNRDEEHEDSEEEINKYADVILSEIPADITNLYLKANHNYKIK